MSPSDRSTLLSIAENNQTLLDNGYKPEDIAKMSLDDRASKAEGYRINPETMAISALASVGAFFTGALAFVGLGGSTSGTTPTSNGAPIAQVVTRRREDELPTNNGDGEFDPNRLSSTDKAEYDRLVQEAADAERAAESASLVADNGNTVLGYLNEAKAKAAEAKRALSEFTKGVARGVGVPANPEETASSKPPKKNIESDANYPTDPSKLPVTEKIKFDASREFQGPKDEGGWYSQWYSKESKGIDVSNNPNFDMSDRTYPTPGEAERKLHYKPPAKDIPNKMDWNFPDDKIPGPAREFKALYVGPGNKVPNDVKGMIGEYTATKNQGNVVVIETTDRNGKPFYMSIGHNEYINQAVIDSARTGAMLPPRTYIGTSGAVGWMEVSNPSGTGRPGIHTHFTFSEDRVTAMNILNGTD